MWAPPKTATIVITTKNRREELRRSLVSCVLQLGSPEILVIDDGSTDGTVEMVKTEFPTVSVKCYDESLGYIVRRNEGAAIASGEIVVSIDDDAEFSHPGVVLQTLVDFEHPQIAAVAIPFINVRLDRVIRQRAPDDKQVWITNEFVGTAYAVRKDIFEQFGGYRDSLLHQHEEGDFCIKLLDAAYYVRLGRAEPVIHYLSSNRSNERMEVFGQRNLMLFAWHNVPVPNLIWHLPSTVFNGLLWGVSRKCFWYRLRGTFLGTKAIVQYFRSRKPVRARTNAIFRQLKKAGPKLLQQLDPSAE